MRHSLNEACSRAGGAAGLAAAWSSRRPVGCTNALAAVTVAFSPVSRANGHLRFNSFIRLRPAAQLRFHLEPQRSEIAKSVDATRAFAPTIRSSVDRLFFMGSSPLGGSHSLKLPMARKKPGRS
jgi:hypothetical protein